VRQAEETGGPTDGAQRRGRRRELKERLAEGARGGGATFFSGFGAAGGGSWRRDGGRLRRARRRELEGRLTDLEVRRRRELHGWPAEGGRGQHRGGEGTLGSLARTCRRSGSGGLGVGFRRAGGRVPTVEKAVAVVVPSRWRKAGGRAPAGCGGARQRPSVVAFSQLLCFPFFARQRANRYAGEEGIKIPSNTEREASELCAGSHKGLNTSRHWSGVSARQCESPPNS
jgi:hypothetical protein